MYINYFASEALVLGQKIKYAKSCFNNKMIPTKLFEWINEWWFDGQIDHEIQICDWVFLYTSKQQAESNMVFLYNPVYGSDIPYIQF